MRPVISFDIDGVIADGAYTPPEQRTNDYYFRKALIDPLIPAYLEQFSIAYDIYLVSFRHHRDANLGTRAWVTFALGLAFDTIAGIVTYPPSALDGPDADYDWKRRAVSVLGSVVHFDDQPNVIASLPGIGVLFPSDYPGSQDSGLPTVRSWEEIRSFLLTPGFTLHGASTSVSSPATDEVRLPSAPLASAVPMN